MPTKKETAEPEAQATNGQVGSPWAGGNIPAPPAGVPHIVVALHAALTDIDGLGAIEQTGKGPAQHQGYPYHTPGKITATARQAFVKHGIALVSRVTVLKQEDLLETPYPFGELAEFAKVDGEQGKQVAIDALTALRGKGDKGIPKARTTAVIRGEFDLYSVVDGSMVTISADASARDDGDKALRKAATTAYKVALMQTLMISSDEGDFDADTSAAATGADEAPSGPDRGAQQRETARGGDPRPARQAPKREQPPAAAPEPEQQAPNAQAKPAAATPPPSDANAAKAALRASLSTLKELGYEPDTVKQGEIAKSVGVTAPRVQWLKDAAAIGKVVGALDGIAAQIRETGEIPMDTTAGHA